MHTVLMDVGPAGENSVALRVNAASDMQWHLQPNAVQVLMSVVHGIILAMDVDPRHAS